jgi:hypothetical protein
MPRTAALTPAQAEWLTQSVPRISTTLGIDEVTCHSILTSCLHWNGDHIFGTPSAYDRTARACLQIKTLAAGYRGDIFDLLDDYGYLAIADDTAA